MYMNLTRLPPRAPRTTLAQQSGETIAGEGGRGEEGEGKEKKKEKKKKRSKEKSPPCHPFSHTAINPPPRDRLRVVVLVPRELSIRPRILDRGEKKEGRAARRLHDVLLNGNGTRRRLRYRCRVVHGSQHGSVARDVASSTRYYAKRERKANWTERRSLALGAACTVRCRFSRQRGRPRRRRRRRRRRRS